MDIKQINRSMKFMAGGFSGLLLSLFLLLHFDLMDTAMGNAIFIAVSIPLTLLTSWHAGLLMFPDRND